MADNKNKGLSEQEILTRVDALSKESVGWYDSRLSRERQRVINFYNSTLPRRRSEGSSSYISTDVYDSVESMKAQIVETFSANPDNLVSFPPLGQDDVESSRIATEYCNHVVWSENDGLGLIHDATHDGLTARAGIAKVFWEPCTERIEETFSGIPYQDVQALTSQKEVADLEANADENSPDPTNPTFSGHLYREYDCSGVKLEPLPPEEFLIEPRARTIDKANYCAHRTLKTKAELIDLGYDRTKVMALSQEDSKSLDLSPEVLARESQVESQMVGDAAIQPETEKVMFFESYVRMDMRDGKGVRLYKLCHVGSALLAKDEVDRAPFKAFVPLPIPHMFFGNNFAQRVVPTQNARTVLTRGILDHTATTTNPRWGVVKGGLLNPREMLDNRQGGIVNMTRPDAVKALEQANLNPFVFQTLEMLKMNKEESTGISALSQGLNKDAISTQNSAALVDNLVQLSTQRQKIIARNFAKFLSEIYLEVYRLVLENQDKEKSKIVKVAGNFVPVTTKDWKERTTCKVALHLGYGERDRQAAKFAAAYKELASDPAIGPMFGPQNRYTMLMDGLKAAAFENYSAYLTPPAKVDPPQPDPIKVAETKAKSDTAQAAVINAQANAEKVKDDTVIDHLRQQLDEAKEQIKALQNQNAESRKDAEVANKINVSQREIALAEREPRENTTTYLAPNG